MMTKNGLFTVPGIDPTLLKLSDDAFLSKDRAQYITNYFIFLDINEILENIEYIKKNEIKINDFLINRKTEIQKDLNKIAKNYDKK
jgi:hypothetical protein